MERTPSIGRIPTLFLSTLLILPSALRAVSPMAGMHDLVAGWGDAGSQDGPFYSAQFNSPRYLAIDPRTRTLFVSDLGNKAIRTIALGDQNKVRTLLSGGILDRPGILAFAPGHGLVLVDDGRARLFLIDPVKGNATTLIGTGSYGAKDGVGTLAEVGDVQGMACDPRGDFLLFSQPEAGVLRELDLRTLRTRTLLSKNDRIPHPRAVFMNGGSIYLSDRDNGNTFQLRWKNDDRTGPPDLDLVHQGPKVLALFGDKGSLYAFQADPAAPLAQYQPENRTVRSLTQWGDPIEDPSYYFDRIKADRTEGSFVADPDSPRKFYAACPRYNLISSFQDLRYAETNGTESYNSQGIMDFEYPAAKPPGTFRILLLGDSHLFHDYHPGQDLNNRTDLVAKKLELELNLFASLSNSPVHFQVLTQAQKSWDPLNTWPYYRTPPIAKKYDIDLVAMVLMKNFNLDNYFQGPLDPSGVPAENADGEFVLKPWKERIQGAVPRALYAICGRMGLADKTSGQIILDYAKLSGDPEALDLMARMYALPLRRLGEKLRDIKNGAGTGIRTVVFLSPYPSILFGNARQGLWDRVLRETRVPYEDLTPAWTALRLSLFPISEMKDNDHFDANGHRVLATMLFQAMVRNQWVPLDPFPRK